MPAYAPSFYSGASAGAVEGISKKSNSMSSTLDDFVEAGCTRSNFIKGVKLIEDYMQVGRY